MRLYDIKIYDSEGEEQETVRDCHHAQMLAITSALRRLEVKHLVKQMV